jgi:hypothetical protein
MRNGLQTAWREEPVLRLHGDRGSVEIHHRGFHEGMAELLFDGAFRETPPGTQILGKRFEFPFQFRLLRGKNSGNHCNLLSRLLLTRVTAPFAASRQVNSSAAALSDQAQKRSRQVEGGKTV